MVHSWVSVGELVGYGYLSPIVVIGSATSIGNLAIFIVVDDGSQEDEELFLAPETNGFLQALSPVFQVLDREQETSYD